MTGKSVSVENYVRAESDSQFKGYAERHGCFGRLVHSRTPYDVMHQITVRGNRDTLYSFGVFDLTSPVTVTLPVPGDRYQSLMTVSQDHSIEVFYGPGDITLSADDIGTRYTTVVVRTFMDPKDLDDVAEAHSLQDEVEVHQENVGVLDLPAWNETEVADVRNQIAEVGALATDSSKMFGRRDQLDPVYWVLGAAVGWGGLPAQAAMYGITFPKNNDGETPHSLTVRDVPVDAFWSVTVYDSEGWIPVNEYDAYSYNGVTADKSDDGSVTIHFGGEPDQENFLPISEGWNYIFRAYRPQRVLLEGAWQYPQATPTQ